MIAIDKHCYLSWYRFDGCGDLIGQELLDVSKDVIRDWFQCDDLQNGLIVKDSQRKQLQELVRHKIDFNQFLYLVEYLFLEEF